MTVFTMSILELEATLNQLSFPNHTTYSVYIKQLCHTLDEGEKILRSSYPDVTPYLWNITRSWPTLIDRPHGPYLETINESCRIGKVAHDNIFQEHPQTIHHKKVCRLTKYGHAD